MNLLLAALALTIAGQDSVHNHAPQLGKVSFESSCNADAAAKLQRGLGWLHSFEYEEAERTFAQAASADPRCAIAHWGVAMSNYHPLWAAPSPAELAKGRAALARAREIGASKREQDYVAALEAFYRDSDRVDHGVRVLAHASAMEQLHRRYPNDGEAAVFYALSLVAAGLLDDDPGYQREKAAAAILTAVLEREPDHPGAVHYLIHSFDYPPLAHLALPAARRYASIAPASAHAQHMPSHIFTRLGLWDEVIRSNQAADAAGRAYAKSQRLPDAWDERLHAMDYLAYGYLQTGRDTDAQRVLDELKAIARVDPPSFKVAYAATAIPARMVLERRQWRDAASLDLPPKLLKLAPLAKFRWAEAPIHLARAVGAARSGDPARARDEVEKLRRIEQAITVPAGEYDWRRQVSIQRQIGEAWLAHAEGRKDEAARLMRAAADMDDATEKHPVMPGAILPAREQLGELLLELGRPVEALTEYESSLKRAPRRLVGLYGAGRAARLAGDKVTAGGYYTQLVELTKNSDGTRAEVQEARAFAAEFAVR